LRESVEVKRDVEVVREALAERLAVWVSVSSSYIIESVGVRRNEGAANKIPPVANFFPLESLLVAVHPLLVGLLHCNRGLLVCCVLLIAEVVAERIIFIVDFICIYKYNKSKYIKRNNI